jgi:hypothetical protein
MGQILSTGIRLNKEQKSILVEKYKTGNYTCVDLAIEFGIADTTCANIIRKANIHVFNNQSVLQRKYALDESFFDIIDSEAKSYFLGLLFADGCNMTKDIEKQ